MSAAKRLHAMARLGAAKPAGLDLAFYDGRSPSPARPPSCDPADETPRPAPDRLRVAGRGPLPVATSGGAYRLHDSCGGKGCPTCSGTGFASMGAVAIAALDAEFATTPEPEPPAPEPRPRRRAKASPDQLMLFAE